MLRVILLTFLAILVLSGCSSDRHIIEDVGFIESSAVDTGSDGNVKVTLCVPVVSEFSSGGPPENEILQAYAASYKQARVQLSRQSNRILASGQLRNLVYSKELAKQGLGKYLDTLMRDPSFSKRSNFIISEGDAGELISSSYDGNIRTSQYIEDVMTKEYEQQNMPQILLHHFIRDFFNEGIDPIATMLKQNKEHVEITGIALFRKDKYITEINAEDVFFFQLMYQNQSKGEFSILLNNKETTSIMFNAITSHKKIRVNHKPDQRHQVIIHLDVSGGVLEYIGEMDLATKERRLVEKQVEEYITEQAQKMVKFMQKNRVDSLGIGRYVRNSMSHEEWKSKDWNDDVFPNLDIEVHTHFEIRNFGNFSTRNEIS